MVKSKFIEYIAFEKRYSPHTIRSYQVDLQQFSEFLDLFYKQINIQDADHNLIRSWIVYLHDHKKSNRTINRKLSTLKSFYKFLLLNNYIDVNPMIKVAAPKNASKIPVFIEQESMTTLLDKLYFDNGFYGIRDRVIIELLYCTGMRVNELINLEENDINLRGKNLKVMGKRQKERIIPLSDKMLDLINSYIEIKNENDFSNTFFITTNKGKKSYHKMIYRIVIKYLNKVSTVTKKSPHVLRHTFATHMLNNGADLNAIKEILGHANLSTTQIYTHNTIDKLRNVYKQAHPRA
jgi:integrase/recombinase XerC